MGATPYATTENYRRSFPKVVNPTELIRPNPEAALLQFQPQFEQLEDALVLTAKVDDPAITPWGLWGAVVAIVAGIALLAIEGLTAFHSFWLIATAVTFVGLGAVLARFGPRTSLKTIELLSVYPHLAEFRVGGHTFMFAEVTEIVYAMVKYPLEKDDQTLRVQAFTALARVGDDMLIPLVEASPDKDHVFTVARAFSRWTGRSVTHVGLGVQSPK